MMFKGIVSISMGALLLAAAFLAALETWIDLHATETQGEISRIDEARSGERVSWEPRP